LARAAVGRATEVSAGVEAAQFGALYEAVEDGDDLGAALGLRAVVVFAAQSHGAQHSLGAVVVDVQVRVVDEGGDAGPVAQADRELERRICRWAEVTQIRPEGLVYIGSVLGDEIRPATVRVLRRERPGGGPLLPEYARANAAFSRLALVEGRGPRAMVLLATVPGYLVLTYFAGALVWGLVS